MFTPPTDYLAKFLAVLGLMFVISSLGIIWSAYKENEKIHIRTEAILGAHDETKAFGERNADLLYEEKLSLKAVALSPNAETLKQFEQVSAKRFELTEEMNRRIADITELSAKAELAYSHFWMACVMGLFGVFIGERMSTWGFQRWIRIDKQSTAKNDRWRGRLG